MASFNKRKPSFFERLTGSVTVEDESGPSQPQVSTNRSVAQAQAELVEEEGEGQLTVDVYQTPDAIIIQSMVAGVKPDDLDISITREMVTIKGNRAAPANVLDQDYFFRELYWGKFSRTIILPQEIEPEEAEASERYGLLTIRLPKVQKDKIQKIKVKSSQ